jgi:hypothetical protein
MMETKQICAAGMITLLTCSLAFAGYGLERTVDFSVRGAGPITLTGVSPNSSSAADGLVATGVGSNGLQYLCAFNFDGTPRATSSGRSTECEEMFISDAVYRTKDGQGENANIWTTPHPNGAFALLSKVRGRGGDSTPGSGVMQLQKRDRQGNLIATFNGGRPLDIIDTCSEANFAATLPVCLMHSSFLISYGMIGGVVALGNGEVWIAAARVPAGVTTDAYTRSQAVLLRFDGNSGAYLGVFDLHAQLASAPAYSQALQIQSHGDGALITVSSACQIRTVRVLPNGLIDKAFAAIEGADCLAPAAYVIVADDLSIGLGFGSSSRINFYSSLGAAAGGLDLVIDGNVASVLAAKSFTLRQEMWLSTRDGTGQYALGRRTGDAWDRAAVGNVGNTISAPAGLQLGQISVIPINFAVRVGDRLVVIGSTAKSGALFSYRIGSATALQASEVSASNTLLFANGFPISSVEDQSGQLRVATLQKDLSVTRASIPTVRDATNSFRFTEPIAGSDVWAVRTAFSADGVLEVSAFAIASNGNVSTPRELYRLTGLPPIQFGGAPVGYFVGPLQRLSDGTVLAWLQTIDFGRGINQVLPIRFNPTTGGVTISPPLTNVFGAGLGFLADKMGGVWSVDFRGTGTIIRRLTHEGGLAANWPVDGLVLEGFAVQERLPYRDGVWLKLLDARDNAVRYRNYSNFGQMRGVVDLSGLSFSGATAQEYTTPVDFETGKLTFIEPFFDRGASRITRYDVNGNVDLSFGLRGADVANVVDGNSGLAQYGGRLWRQVGSHSFEAWKQDNTVRSETFSSVIEFYNTTLDHYFMTADQQEIKGIETGAAGPGWSRTGETFQFYESVLTSPGDARGLCRFYGSTAPNAMAPNGRDGPNSHVYIQRGEECSKVRNDRGWIFEGDLGAVVSAAQNGVCPSGFSAITRTYNNGYVVTAGKLTRNDSNHRYTRSPNIQAQMKAKGWSDEGVVFCAK